MRFPPMPELPEPLRGRALVSITLAFTGSEAEGNELVAPLRAIARPTSTRSRLLPAGALGGLAGDPPGPLPGIGNAVLLDVVHARGGRRVRRARRPGRRQSR